MIKNRQIFTYTKRLLYFDLSNNCEAILHIWVSKSLISLMPNFLMYSFSHFFQIMFNFIISKNKKIIHYNKRKNYFKTN